MTEPITWILLRGWSRQALHWGRFPKLLAQVIPESAVRTLDLPGTGQHHQEQSPNTVTKIVNWIRPHFLSRLEPGKKNYVLGLSFGAVVATAWANMFPQDFFGLVLINASFSNFSPFFHRLRPSVWPRVARFFVSTNTKSREQKILHMVSNLPEKRRIALEPWTQIQEDRPISMRDAFAQLRAAMRYCAPGQLPTARVLILNSANDRLVHPNCSVQIHAHWGGQLRTHPSAGHDLPLDDPDWVLEQIQNWLQTEKD